MSTKQRIDLATAQELAEELIALLSPACERIVIAGSIRRQAPTVGDIELLAEPTTTTRPLDLFGEVVETDDHLDALVKQLLDAGTFAPRLDVNGRPALGDRYKRLIYKGTALDLFACKPPAQWGLLYAIRTGPGGFSQRLVTDRRKGGLLPPGWTVDKGRVWDAYGHLVPTPTEAALFAALGLAPIPPEARTEDWTL